MHLPQLDRLSWRYSTGLRPLLHNIWHFHNQNRREFFARQAYPEMGPQCRRGDGLFEQKHWWKHNHSTMTLRQDRMLTEVLFQLGGPVVAFLTGRAADSAVMIGSRFRVWIPVFCVLSSQVVSKIERVPEPVI